MRSASSPDTPDCCAICTPHGEERQAQRVGHEQRAEGRNAQVYVQEGECGGRQADHEELGMRNPDDRVAIEQKIPHRATSERRHHGDDGDAEPVEALPPRGEGAADGEYGDAYELEDVADALASPSLGWMRARLRRQLTPFPVASPPPSAGFPAVSN